DVEDAENAGGLGAEHLVPDVRIDAGQRNVGAEPETSSAPSVNQMRFFSSSALASAPKLRFAASCSAAETMFGFLPPPLVPSLGQIAGNQADAGHYLVLGSDKSIAKPPG